MLQGYIFYILILNSIILCSVECLFYNTFDSTLSLCNSHNLKHFMFLIAIPVDSKKNDHRVNFQCCTNLLTLDILSATLVERSMIMNKKPTID